MFTPPKHGEATEGRNNFKEVIDSAVGDRDKLAEFSVGLNPKARFINDIIVDKKELGTVHIAIGNNKGPTYGGRTTAASTET